LTAVGYSDVLNTTVSVSQLDQSAIKVLGSKSTLSGAAAIQGLQHLKLATRTTTVLLRDLQAIHGAAALTAHNTNLRL
ncbi:hypothetical protein RA267_29980, partial [Pseudomonas syringae pv. tagetis]